MDARIREQIDQLRRLTVGGLKERHLELFGYESRSSNKRHLFRRLAWRLQALAEGDLSERARQRALEITDDADLRVRPPQAFLDELEDDERVVKQRLPPAPDDRLPLPGTLLTRHWQGEKVVVKVLDGGFEHRGRFYKSLSAVASEIAGTRWNGYAFFGLTRGKRNGR